MNANTFSYYLVFADGQSQSVTDKTKFLWWQERGLSFTRSGYGNKIPSEMMVRFNKRWHRVYCRICSNSGYCYILVKGHEIKVERYADCGD